ncbi:hypothetical protein BDZ45DRAFT_221668 [Acephala macrosclerotiorum]|nr:hypothetical protein BDZ45DRAFT_221668 [Acephala macrosclerotiorum]
MSSLLHLAIALVFLTIDSAIELALISSMVGYLHRSGANQYPFQADDGSTILVNAKPKGLLLNEGHTSNGAAGTALVIVSIGGWIVLWWMRRRDKLNETPRPSRIFLGYTIWTILSFCLTTSALAYTFAVTNQTNNQSIDPTVAAQFQGHAYPLLNWTPGNWEKALLALPLTSDKDRKYLEHWSHVIEGWKWNLIPLFLIGLVVMVLSVRVYLEQRTGRRLVRNSKI